MLFRIFAGVLLPAMLLASTAAAVEIESDAELYGEEATPAYRGSGRKWVEENVQLPSYPDRSKLFKVDLQVDNFPFTLLIDPASLTVGDDRVVRFTSVLRSPSGVDNVEFLGLRCSKRMVRRYAWGEEGRFRVLPDSKWRYIQKTVQDRWLDALLTDFLCPLPGYSREKALLDKLKRPNPKNFLYDQDDP